jgi:thioredoxin reductase (NADPH)
MSQNPTKHTKVLIIGSGPAGYTAAVYAARAMLNPVLVYGSAPGGQLTTTTDVENFPGFADVIQGPWLMDQMRDQAKAVGTEMIEDHISSVNLKSKPFEAVVGGGNAAVEEAMFLTKFASKVKLIHRRDELRAEKMLQKKLMENKKIEIIWDSAVDEVIGDGEPKNVTGIKVKNLKTNEIQEMKIDGLFIAIGHDPATALFKEQLDMDKEGYLLTKPDSTETNIPGVYAAGDVKDKTFRQAVTAAGMGCMAALEAEKFLSH